MKKKTEELESRKISIYTWDILQNVINNQIVQVKKDFFVYADYNKKTNETTIRYFDWHSKAQKLKYAGIKIIELFTDKGGLGYQL